MLNDEGREKRRQRIARRDVSIIERVSAEPREVKDKGQTVVQ